MSEDHGFKVIKSKLIHKGRIVTLLDEELEYPDGQVFLREVVRHRGAVGVVPLTTDGGQVVLVEQYRHPVAREVLEIPAGIPAEGEDPLDCARRELKEETGLSSEKIVKLTEFYTTPGYSDEVFHLYLGVDVKEGEMEPEDDEVLKVIKLPLEQALEMVKTGEIRDAKTIVGLLLADRFIKKEL